MNVANNGKSFSRTFSRPASSVVMYKGSNIAVTFMLAIGRTLQVLPDKPEVSQYIPYGYLTRKCITICAKAAY
jgi:hypothetical protein